MEYPFKLVVWRLYLYHLIPNYQTKPFRVHSLLCDESELSQQLVCVWVGVHQFRDAKKEKHLLEPTQSKSWTILSGLHMMSRK